MGPPVNLPLSPAATFCREHYSPRIFSTSGRRGTWDVVVVLIIIVVSVGDALLSAEKFAGGEIVAAQRAIEVMKAAVRPVPAGVVAGVVASTDGRACCSSTTDQHSRLGELELRN